MPQVLFALYQLFTFNPNAPLDNYLSYLENQRSTFCVIIKRDNNEEKDGDNRQTEDI